MPKIAIIGTGLIGASIGLRLKTGQRTSELEVAGYDREPQHLRDARRLGAIDVAARSLADAVRDAELVVLSTPVLSLRRLMIDLAPLLGDGAAVTDTGSTKAEVMEWAGEELPQHVSFVGGHPMAGKTETGPKAADAALFEGARWVIVPSARARESALQTVRGLVESMGATQMFMDAAEHDAYVAAISHLPLMAATAMFTLLQESEAWPELSLLAATGFGDSTRLASTDANIGFDIAVTNRAQIIHWLERYREALHDLQERIADDAGEEELFRHMAQASWDHATFTAGKVGRTEIDEKSGELPSMNFASFMVGEAAARKMREVTERSEERLRESERKRRLTRGE